MADDLASEMDNCVLEFNLLLKPLVLRIEEKYSENGSIYRLRKRLFLALSNDERLALMYLGPSLWNHRESIMKRDEEHFLNFDYTQTVENVRDEKDGQEGEGIMDKKEKNILVDFITVVKRDYPQLNKAEKDDTYNTIKGMLIEYAKYVKIEKKLKTNTANQ